jgi:hypothetical protein
MKTILVYTVMACIAFMAALFVRGFRNAAVSADAAQPAANAPDSVQLAARGITPGAQLVAYAFGGSHCGFCQKTETKQAFAALRNVLTARYVARGQYKNVSVIGVAVDGEIKDGLGYLESIGPNAFNEISVGSGWQNENIIRLIRQRHAATLGLPLVIVISRSMNATLSPLTMSYGEDSVLTYVQGAHAIAEWVRNGATIVGPTSGTPSVSTPVAATSPVLRR